MDDPVVDSGKNKGSSSKSERPDRSGLQRPSHLMGTGVSFPGYEASGREVNHLATSSAEVKNEWSCTSAPPLRLCDVDREKSTPLVCSQTHLQPFMLEAGR